MRLKLYRAARMSEAMAQVRAELGKDALILGTRRIGDGVEVTAALEPDEFPIPAVQSQSIDPMRQAVLDFHVVPPALRPALQYGDLHTALADALPFDALPLSQGARPLLVVGPPGAVAPARR
jgi:flagellar biosynthesis protein FlhF